MDNETTIKMPLPPDTIPNQEDVPTQPIKFKTPFPKVQLPVPVSVPLPWHLQVDPIVDMPAPVMKHTPIFDQIYGPGPEPTLPPVRRRYQLSMADYFLIGLGALATAMLVGIWGFIQYGWGAGEPPEEKPEVAYVAPEEPSESPSQTRRPSRSPSPIEVVPEPLSTSRAPAPDPTTARPSPTPEKSRPVIVVPEPRPTTERPSAHPTTPSPTPTPSPSETTPEPTPSTSPPATPSPTSSGESQDG